MAFGFLTFALTTGDASANLPRPGSVLVFPVHRSGVFLTIINVTNTNLTPMTPLSLGGSTNLHYEYVNVTANPANTFCPTSCTVFDRVEFLTPADTLSVATNCHNVAGGVGQEGFLVVSAEDPTLFNTAFAHNDLIGSAIVLHASGSMYMLNAISLQAMALAGTQTDVDLDGQLDFNGTEYEPLPDLLMIDSFLAASEPHLTLINLTGGTAALNTVLFQVWNDNEFPLSATLSFKCWFDEPLVEINPLFEHDFMVTNLPHDPGELDINCDGTGDFETGWTRIDSILVSAPGGAVIDFDGAMLGAVTAGPGTIIDGGAQLWSNGVTQSNGQFIDFGY